MTVSDFRLIDEPAAAESSGRLAVLSSQRERLAIVSTRNKLCGIASYTQALERHLADLFDITVFDLDQYLLRPRHARLRKLGDGHIKAICAELGEFDAVSLQLEFGTLGCEARDIARRLGWLVRAAPRLSVTFHTLIRPPAFPFREVAKAAARFQWGTAIDLCGGFFYDNRLSVGVARMVRRAQRH